MSIVSKGTFSIFTISFIRELQKSNHIIGSHCVNVMTNVLDTLLKQKKDASVTQTKGQSKKVTIRQMTIRDTISLETSKLVESTYKDSVIKQVAFVFSECDVPITSTAISNGNIQTILNNHISYSSLMKNVFKPLYTMNISTGKPNITIWDVGSIIIYIALANIITESLSKVILRQIDAIVVHVGSDNRDTTIINNLTKVKEDIMMDFKISGTSQYPVPDIIGAVLNNSKGEIHYKNEKISVIRAMRSLI